MAEEYYGGANKRWDSSSSTNRSRFDGGSSASSATTLSDSGGGGGYRWLMESSSANIDDMDTARSSSSFHVTEMGGPSLLETLGLSSPATDWSQQPLMNQEKEEKSLNLMVQQDQAMGLTTNLQQLDWGLSDKQLGRHGFSLDQPQPPPPPPPPSSGRSATCQALTGSSFQLDSTTSSSSTSSVYPLNYQHNYFGLMATNSNDPQQNQLQFTNNASYWNNASLTQLPIPTLENKPMNMLELRDMSSTEKKSGTESNSKRTKNEGASSTLPQLKVRKEKTGDRITALQQLVSPFGKTDTASVLSEAIEYIKFLHEQVGVLSTPYLNNGAIFQRYQSSNEKTTIESDEPRQDLRSRGLCLVPVSSTFPIAHETTIDFWTPPFGGTLDN